MHVFAAIIDDQHSGQGDTAWPAEATPPRLMDDAYWEQFSEPLSLYSIGIILRVSEATALRRLQDGTIPAHFIGRSWVVFKGEFRVWLASTRNEPQASTVDADPLAGYGDELGMSDLMDLFDKTKQTLRRWLTDKQIPGYLLAGRWIVYKTELREALARTSNQRNTNE